DRPQARRAPRAERLRARGRRRLPHLLVLRPRHGCPERDLAAARPDGDGARRARRLAAPTRRIRERGAMNLPPVVSPTEWQAALDAHRAKEKEATRSRDALAAERRRLPRVRVEKGYTFD